MAGESKDQRKKIKINEINIKNQKKDNYNYDENVYESYAVQYLSKTDRSSSSSSSFRLSSRSSPFSMKFIVSWLLALTAPPRTNAMWCDRSPERWLRSAHVDCIRCEATMHSPHSKCIFFALVDRNGRARVYTQVSAAHTNYIIYSECVHR